MEDSRSGEREPPPAIRRPVPWTHLAGRLWNIVQHTVVTLACLLSIWLVHYVLQGLLGPEWEFIDLIPIRYVIDIGELAVLGKLLWRLVKESE